MKKISTRLGAVVIAVVFVAMMGSSAFAYGKGSGSNAIVNGSGNSVSISSVCNSGNSNVKIGGKSWHSNYSD